MVYVLISRAVFIFPLLTSLSDLTSTIGYGMLRCQITPIGVI
jgi:hypothetical protein